MLPVIWTLVQNEEIIAALKEAAQTIGAQLRFFSDVASILAEPEPASGEIIALEAAGAQSNYIAVIKRIQKNFFFLDCIVFGPPKSEEELDRERELGVDRYFSLPLDKEEFTVMLAETAALRTVKSAARIVGRSAAINEMLSTVLQVAPTDVPVLIEGESGSGKELTAHAIHLMSRRRDKPFEAVNCGAFAEGVLESELFGHERGSFTGAISRRQGLFERINKGTLFLDEVGEMTLNMQVKLLRVIETGEFMRVGGTERLRTDVRIIAATNRELESSVERREFRKDLYYRLKVVRIFIPPLRARPEDIPLLANYFLAQSSRRLGKRLRGIEKEGMDRLVNYPWPGNVRELSNVIDNLTIMSQEGTIRAEEIDKRLKEGSGSGTLSDLPVHVRKTREELERELILNSIISLHNDVREILRLLKGQIGSSQDTWKSRAYVEVAEEEPRSLEKLEREAIKEALAANAGNRRKAAKQLGISERTLYRRIQEYGL